MSMPTYQSIPKIRFGFVPTELGSTGREIGDAKARGWRLPEGGWAPLILGGSALSLFLTIVRVWGLVPLVMVAPFVVIGLAGSMGLRSLGR